MRQMRELQEKNARLELAAEAKTKKAGWLEMFSILGGIALLVAVAYGILAYVMMPMLVLLSTTLTAVRGAYAALLRGPPLNTLVAMMASSVDA